MPGRSYPQGSVRAGGGGARSGTVEGTRWRRAAGNSRRTEMSQGGYVTLVGFVAQDPNIRTTATGLWRDAETSYYNVSCWARLADHVRASLHKGDPVIVKGRFRTSTFEDKNGQLRTAIEITADTVGHDLSRGPANYIRLRPQRVNTEDD